MTLGCVAVCSWRPLVASRHLLLPFPWGRGGGGRPSVLGQVERTLPVDLFLAGPCVISVRALHRRGDVHAVRLCGRAVLELLGYPDC